MNTLKKHLSNILPFTENELAIFANIFTEKQLKKNDYFACQGEFSTKMAFVSKGILRAFYRNNKGNEYNKTFFYKNSFVGAYSSLLTKAENKINIQCLTDCILFTANFKEITMLYDTYPKIERLARILAEQFFISKEKREIELVMLDALERYNIFKNEHPNLENSIPQYHIASYLGITPTQLSRIRAKK